MAAIPINVTAQFPLAYEIGPYYFCCELTLIRDVTQEGEPILAGTHFSRVHIYATKYWQLVMTCTYPNLSQIIIRLEVRYF